MRNIKLSLIASLAIGMCTSASANSFEEALKNGKVSGEFAVTYEKRSVDKELAKWGNYYNNTSYSVGSFALKYVTGEWNNISLTSKFRGYRTLFEGGKDEYHFQGYGDSAERFWDKDGTHVSADIEELFLGYKNDMISVKAGRQFIFTDWMNKTQDALRVDANFGNTAIEAIWSYRHGRIYERDYRPMSRTNEGDGVYKLGLTQNFTENISATVYDFIVPDVRDIMGAKANLKFGNISFGAHYAKDKSDIQNTEDTSLLELKLSTTVAGFTPFAGFVKIDDDADFTWTTAGETVNPFEEGDQIFRAGAETYYLGLSSSFGDLSGTLLFGSTEYKEGKEKYEQNETTLWLGYPVLKNLKANLGYTVVNVDDKDVDETDLNQVNLTLIYSF